MFGVKGFESPSSDKKVDGDLNFHISTASGDVKVKGSNLASINSASGDVKVKQNNIGTINTASGDIEVEGGNKGTLKTASGDIETNYNNGYISSASGDIKISGENSGNIKTISGDVEVGMNNGKITTVHGEVTIGNIKIKIIKNSINSIGGTINITGNSISSIIIGGNVIINGVDQLKGKSGENNKYQVEIGGVLIDFYKKIYTSEGKQYPVTINENEAIYIKGDSIIAIYAGQKIIISELQVDVNKIK